MIKITPESKLLIWGCSKEVRSGGAEVLNLLAATLKKLGVNAKMFNWNMWMYEQPEYYRNLYDVNCGSWEEIKDDENIIVLLPEMMLEDPVHIPFFTNFKNVQYIFWWLSSSFDYNEMDIKNSKRLLMNKLKALENRSVNAYENEMCSRDLFYYGLNNRIRLQHGINDLYYNSPKLAEKQNIVMYNSMKTETKTYVEEVLLPIMPDIKFEAIRYLGPDRYRTKEDMCRLYDSCKVYIDFCEFEGRELMPREAAVRDCILILGNDGCAQTFDDYPIPQEYKINRYTEQPDKVADIIRKSLLNYDNEIQKFTFFKHKCLCEPLLWMNNVYTLFGNMIPKINIEYSNDGHSISYGCSSN